MVMYWCMNVLGVVVEFGVYNFYNLLVIMDVIE